VAHRAFLNENLNPIHPADMMAGWNIEGYKVKYREDKKGFDLSVKS